LNDYTIGKIVGDVVQGIWKNLQPTRMHIPTKDDFLGMAANAKERWNFIYKIIYLIIYFIKYIYYIIIDGKHVQIKAPSNSDTMYYNYLNYFSVVLQGIADSDCKFIFIDVGWYGKQSDAGNFAESQTYQFLEDFKKNLPKPCPFEGSDGPMPFRFCGRRRIPSENVSDETIPRK